MHLSILSALVLVVSMAPSPSSAQVPVPKNSKDPVGEKPTGTWLTPDLLKVGLSMLPQKSLINTSIDYRPSTRIDFKPTTRIDFKPTTQVGLANVKNTLFGGSLIQMGASSEELKQIEKDRQDFEKKLADIRNEIERSKLEVDIRRLEIQIAQKKNAEDSLALQRSIFKYEKEGLLRRTEYQLKPDKLVVVVADFSVGGTSEGVELADEIANALGELRNKCGVEFEILVGEIKSGVVIRNEQMARDVGAQLPPRTSYAVIWGSMSPRTVGVYRPHVTMVLKTSSELGVSTTYTMDLESQKLPLNSTDEAIRRPKHQQLVAFTCAAIPGCYAAYEISQERSPDLTKLLKYIGEESSEAKLLRDTLAPLLKWPEHRKDYLNRISRVGPGALTVNDKSVEAVVSYPQVVINNKDKSLMTLITKPDSHEPEEFVDKAGKKYIVYIDVTETTWGQFLHVYNPLSEDDQKKWRSEIGFDKDFKNINLDAKGIPVNVKKLEVISEDDKLRPVFSISYKGAEAYCKETGKELPTVNEWQSAARRGDADSIYPWGKAFDPNKCSNDKTAGNREKGEFEIHPVGKFPEDCSGIGCLDMVGNVSEWCEQFSDKGTKIESICGGSYSDVALKFFNISNYKQPRSQSPDIKARSIGFRGVVRIQVK